MRNTWRMRGREYQYRGHHLVTATDGTDGELLTLNIVRGGKPMQLTGRGNGPIDALVHSLALPIDVLSYEEKSIGKGSEARAAAFVEITTPSRVTLFGVGVHANIITASILAVLSAGASGRCTRPVAGAGQGGRRVTGGAMTANPLRKKKGVALATPFLFGWGTRIRT